MSDEIAVVLGMRIDGGEMGSQWLRCFDGPAVSHQTVAEIREELPVKMPGVDFLFQKFKCREGGQCVAIRAEFTGNGFGAVNDADEFSDR